MRRFSNKAKQDWSVGSTVNIGFLKGFVVLEKVATPGDYKPDLYVLRGANNKVYSFVPHNGLTEHRSVEEAREYY